MAAGHRRSCATGAERARRAGPDLGRAAGRAQARVPARGGRARAHRAAALARQRSRRAAPRRPSSLGAAAGAAARRRGPHQPSRTSRRARSWPGSTRACTCRRCRSCARSRRTSSRWTERLAQLPADAMVPRRLVEQAVSLGRAFVADTATDARMIHGDLHYENVLAADREPWLVIDPKPMTGDPHYEVAPMLWNRWEEVVASGDVRGALRRRFHTLVDVAGLDEQRARDWVVVRSCTTRCGSSRTRGGGPAARPRRPRRGDHVDRRRQGRAGLTREIRWRRRRRAGDAMR